jgi:hypothetical protein
MPSLLPSTSSPVNYSRIISSFFAIYSELLTLSLNNKQINKQADSLLPKFRIHKVNLSLISVLLQVIIQNLNKIQCQQSAVTSNLLDKYLQQTTNKTRIKISQLVPFYPYGSTMCSQYTTLA